MYSSNSNQKLAVKQMGHALLSSMGSVRAENHVGPGAEMSPTCVFPLSRLRLAPKAGSKSRRPLCCAAFSRARAGVGGEGGRLWAVHGTGVVSAAPARHCAAPPPIQNRRPHCLAPPPGLFCSRQPWWSLQKRVNHCSIHSVMSSSFCHMPCVVRFACVKTGTSIRVDAAVHHSLLEAALGRRTGRHGTWW